MRWYVEVQVELLLIEVSFDFVVDHGDSEVHEVDLFRRGFTFPSQALTTVHVFAKI